MNNQIAILKNVKQPNLQAAVIRLKIVLQPKENQRNKRRSLTFYQFKLTINGVNDNWKN